MPRVKPRKQPKISSSQLDLFDVFEQASLECEIVPEKKEKKPRKPRTKMPKHKCITRTFKFPIDLSPIQAKRLFDTCDLLLDVRNRLVEELSENRRINREYKAARA